MIMITESTKITSVSWNKIYLAIGIDGDTDCLFSIENCETKERFPLMMEDGSIKLNITNVTGIYREEMLGNGSWRIICHKDGHDLEPALAIDVAEKLEDLGKVFPYWHFAYAYAVVFRVHAAVDDTLCLRMDTRYMMRNDRPRKEYIKLEAKDRKERVSRRMGQLVKHVMQGIYNAAEKTYKGGRNRVLLMSETRAMSGNLEAIDSRIKENYAGRVHLSYYFSETLNLPHHKLAFKWLGLMILMARQDVIVVDDYSPVFKDIRINHDKTRLVQVWHAGVGFKSVGYARFGKEGSPRALESCHRHYDYAVVGGTNLIPVYQEVFGINREKLLPSGVPSIDGFIKNIEDISYRKEFDEKFPEAAGKKIILFAPTYRGEGQQQAYYPYEKLDFGRIAEYCGDETVFLMKMHPFIGRMPELDDDMKKCIIDVSDEDLKELMKISDFMITDYSSVIYEYCLLDKPIIFYAFDRREYEVTRGFHWDFDEYAPGRICTTFDEVMDALITGECRQDKIPKFREFAFDHTDGHNTDRLIETLLLGEDDGPGDFDMLK